jgi:LacI family transcriptional regulator
MQHYLEQGCRRILFVSDRSMTQECEPRYAAYHTAMEAAALPIEILALELPREEHIREQAHRQLREYFAAHGFPDALFCSNDDIAAGAYRALREAGQRIPQQTAVLGCDDLEISQDLSPPLTSIHIPFEEIAQRAWGLLQQRLQNPQRPTQHAELKATLRVRKSSQRPSNRPASARRKIKRKEK